MGIFFTYNNEVYPEGKPVIGADNRGFKYGDGLFETMLFVNGKIQLADLHFQRLFHGLELLQFETPNTFTKENLNNQVLQLCKKNNHNSTARVRLTVFRSNGGLYDAENHPNYIIETNELENRLELNSDGLILDIYTDAKKSTDKFSNIKSNNFLPYVMAALHAKKIQVDDCIVLNNNNRICDTTIANLFLVKDNSIYTPPLTEGCIAGVMRRMILENLKEFNIIEKPITLEELKSAEEVFLTNSIKRIRWVKQFREVPYSNNTIKKIDTILCKIIY